MRMLRAARGPDTVLSVRGWAARSVPSLAQARRHPEAHVVLSC
jgi:hypothetical protein